MGLNDQINKEYSRRGFLRVSAKGTLGLAVGESVISCSGTDEEPTDTLTLDSLCGPGRHPVDDNGDPAETVSEAVGCADAGYDTYTENFELNGTYFDGGSGIRDTITNEAWTAYPPNGDIYIYHILFFDNNQDYFIIQNDANNPGYPSLFSRVSWTTYNDHFWVCGTPDAPTREEAENTPPYYSGDPANTGCRGDFPWKELFPE